MKFTKVLPTKVGTEFVCIWEYENEIDCNVFRVMENEIKVLALNGQEFIKKDKLMTFPWKGPDDIEYKFGVRG